MKRHYIIFFGFLAFILVLLKYMMPAPSQQDRFATSRQDQKAYSDFLSQIQPGMSCSTDVEVKELCTKIKSLDQKPWGILKGKGPVKLMMDGKPYLKEASSLIKNWGWKEQDQPSPKWKVAFIIFIQEAVKSIDYSLLQDKPLFFAFHSFHGDRHQLVTTVLIHPKDLKLLKEEVSEGLLKKLALEGPSALNRLPTFRLLVMADMSSRSKG